MLIILYFLLALIEIVGEYYGILPLIFITKPLLMVVLACWVYMKTKKTAYNKYRKRLLISLGFAFGGDTFLMFFPYNENFFLLGLGSFLFGQLFYAFAFINSIKESENQVSISVRIAFVIIFITYYFLLMSTLFNNLNEFLIPVLVYGIAICLMGLTAAWRYQKVSFQSFFLVFAGAMLFVLSDTIIAVNQFMYKGNLWNAQVLIMLTYVIAQYLLSKGSVLYLKSSETA